MTPIGTCRLYRPDPSSIGVGERWGRASATVTLAPALIVSVRGEVDASNAARFADYVERHAAIATALVVDTSTVDFFGASAVGALHRIDHCRSASGVGWRLVVGPAVRRVMRVCGTPDLPEADNVIDALRQLGVDQPSVV